MSRAARILLVDDQVDNLLILDDLLSPRYTVHTAADGAEAMAYFDQGGDADMVITDVLMPIMDGFTFCRQLKNNPRLKHIPVLFLTSVDNPADEERALSMGAEDFIHKPFSPPSVLARVNNHIRLTRATMLLRDQNASLERIIEERTSEIRKQANAIADREHRLIKAQSATITAFCSLAEARDNETGNHIRRTQHYVKTLAAELRSHPRFAADLDDSSINLMFRSAPLHDIGKIAIPDAILLKPGPLSPDEWTVMQRHCELGCDAIAIADAQLGEEASFLRFARQIASSHHERWDGGGYPRQLRGEGIPLAARLMAVADVYDALTTARVYKPAFPHVKAMELLIAGREHHFDPIITDAAVGLGNEFKKIAATFSDDAPPPKGDYS